MNCDFLFIGIYQCQFLSPEDAVEYLQSLQDEEEADLYDQDHTSLTIIPPPVAASDYEDDDDDDDDDIIMVPTVLPTNQLILQILYSRNYVTKGG